MDSASQETTGKARLVLGTKAETQDNTRYFRDWPGWWLSCSDVLAG